MPTFNYTILSLGLPLRLSLSALMLTSTTATANIIAANTIDKSQSNPWFLRTGVGLSQMSDISATATNIDSLSGKADINFDSGFSAGLGLGYQLNPNWAIELYWEYRGNDSQTTIAQQSTFDGGNYASNIFFLNALYWFEKRSNWQPYAGVGISWVQELDIDLERNDVEWSYSTDGDTGFQAFAGASYQLTSQIAVFGEARYGSITGVNLVNEQGLGSFDDIDYQTTTWQVGLSYTF